MARARNIKPGLFKNELLGVADPLLTLLFQSLWTLADKEGRLEDRPLRIKAETFPYRDGLDINGYLTELQRLGFIVRYAVDGLALIQVVNFKKHQTPHNTEKPSELPAHVENTQSNQFSESLTVKQPLSNGENVEALPPDSLIPDSLIPDSGSHSKTSAPDYHEDFESVWNEYPDRPGINKKAAYKAWGARIKAGADKEQIFSGVIRYKRYCLATKTEAQFIKQPETFFGPNEHYLGDWNPPEIRQREPTKSRHDAFMQKLNSFGEQGESKNERDITGVAVRVDS